MADRYVLPLSDVSVTVPQQQVSGNQVVDVQKPLRETEKTMLVNLLDFAANSYKKMRDINCCLTLQQQIEDLPDDQLELIVDDADKDHLTKGIEETMGRRPFMWHKCRALWKALEAWPKAEK